MLIVVLPDLGLLDGLIWFAGSFIGLTIVVASFLIASAVGNLIHAMVGKD